MLFEDLKALNPLAALPHAPASRYRKQVVAEYQELHPGKIVPKRDQTAKKCAANLTY